MYITLHYMNTLKNTQAHTHTHIHKFIYLCVCMYAINLRTYTRTQAIHI